LKSHYAIALVTATLVLAGCGGSGDGEGTAGITVAKAKAGRESGDRAVVAALGRLEPATEVVEVAAPPGDRIASLLVDEGDRVDKCEILALLDSHAERTADLARITSRLEEARLRLSAETSYGNAAIDEAGLRIRELEELRPLEIEAQEALVAALEAEVGVVRRDLERIDSLHQNGVVSITELDHQTLIVRQKEEELRSARATFVRLRDGRDIDLSMARSQEEAARADLIRARTSIGLEELERELDLAASRVERSTIRAPVAGEVFEIHTRAGEITGKGPILSLGDTRTMLTVAEVYETDVRFVEPGQRTTISSPALPEDLAGEVIWVGSSVSRNKILDVNPTADTDRRTVKVKIRLDDNTIAARMVNLQVDVRIDVGQR